MRPPRFTIQVLIVAALLGVARLSFDFTSAAVYVYPKLEFGQSVFSFIFFGLSLLFVVILAVVRLVRRRVIEAVLLLLLCCISLMIPDLVDRRLWRFRTHLPSYTSAITNDPSPGPKYQVFNWGNRNTSVGGGFILEAVVYDESDEIGRDPKSRSREWLERRANPSPDDRWITELRSTYPTCRRETKPLGDHFYYVAEEC